MDISALNKSSSSSSASKPVLHGARATHSHSSDHSLTIFSRSCHQSLSHSYSQTLIILSSYHDTAFSTQRLELTVVQTCIRKELMSSLYVMVSFVCFTQWGITDVKNKIQLGTVYWDPRAVKCSAFAPVLVAKDIALAKSDFIFKRWCDDEKQLRQC